MHSILLELEYRLRNPTLRRYLCAASLAVGALLVAGASEHWRNTQQRLIGLQQQIDAARANVLRSAGPTASETRRLNDFTVALPEKPLGAEVVQALAQASDKAGVALTSVQATARAATEVQLGRTELTVVLRGPYTATREVLDMVLQRYQAVTLARLRLRRLGAPTDLETTATLSVWSRPVAASPTADRPLR